MTIEEMEIRHWLNRAFYADKKAKALDMLVNQCRIRAEGLSSCSGGNDKGKKDSTENSTENALIRLAEMERKVQELRVEAINVTTEIWNAITAIGDDDLEAVLISRYILFQTIEQAAESLGYDARTIKRKTKQAIEKLAPKCPCLPQK